MMAEESSSSQLTRIPSPPRLTKVCCSTIIWNYEMIFLPNHIPKCSIKSSNLFLQTAWTRLWEWSSYVSSWEMICQKNHFIWLTAPPTGNHLLQLLHESVSGVGLCPRPSHLLRWKIEKMRSGNVGTEEFVLCRFSETWIWLVDWNSLMPQQSLQEAKLCWYRLQQAMESRSAIVRCLPREYDGTFREAGPIVVAMRPWGQQGPLG